MPTFGAPIINHKEQEALNNELRAFLRSVGAIFPDTLWTAGRSLITLNDLTERGRALEQAGTPDLSVFKERLILHCSGLVSNNSNPFPHGKCRLTIIRWGEAPDECGKIHIDNHKILNATSIVSYSSVYIGKDVLFGPLVTIMDCDGHPADRALPDIQANRVTRPVVIEDHAWLGLNCTIMKGVTVGHHAVVATQAVVTKDVPPHCVVAGNPARIIKDFSEERAARKAVEAEINPAPQSL